MADTETEQAFSFRPPAKRPRASTLAERQQAYNPSTSTLREQADLKLAKFIASWDYNKTPLQDVLTTKVLNANSASNLFTVLTTHAIDMISTANQKITTLTSTINTMAETQAQLVNALQ